MNKAVLETIKTAAKDSFAYGIGEVAARLVSFFLIPLYTRVLTPADFGVLSIVLVLPAFLSEITSLGIGMAFCRFYFDAPSERGTTTDTAFWFTILASVPFLALMIPASPLVAAMLVGDPGLSLIIKLTFTFICLSNVTRLGFMLLRVERRVGVYSVLNVVRICISLGVTVYLVGIRKLGIIGVVLGQLTSESVALIALASIHAKRVRLRWCFACLRKMLKYSLPLLSVSLAAWLVLSLPVILLGSLSRMAEAGLYGVASKLAWMISALIIRPFLMGWGPAAFSIVNDADPRPTYARMFTYLASLSVWAGAALAICSKPLLQLMTTPQYMEAHDIMPILVLGSVFYGLASFFFVNLEIAKRTSFIAVAWATASLVCVVLCLILIPALGRHGAAIAYVAAFAVAALTAYFLSQKAYRIGLEYGRLAKAFVVAVILYGIGRLINGMTWLEILARVALIGAYPLVLYAVGFFVKEEMEVIARVLGCSRQRESR